MRGMMDWRVKDAEDGDGGDKRDYSGEVGEIQCYGYDGGEKYIRHHFMAMESLRVCKE
jgi:hypothetical protein